MRIGRGEEDGMARKAAKKDNLDMRARRRMIGAFAIISLLFIALAFRIGWITVIANDNYASLAAARQTRDEILLPRRGAVYDRNMTELAVSATSYRVWLRPALAASGETALLREAKLEKIVNLLAEELALEPEAVREMAKRDNTLVRVARDVSKETADRIRERAAEEKKATGLNLAEAIEIEESVSRHYPNGPFAAHVIGSVNDDGQGMGGIELAYDKYLSGVAGRWIKNTDSTGDSLAYGVEKRYEERNGLNVVLTIDEAIQLYVEKAIGKVAEATSAKRVMALVMDPKTGDVLAMGMTPDYDPGDPRMPLNDEEAAYLEGLGADERLNYWNAMWRNPMISDVYDPGSTFKLLTVSAALEEGVASPSDRFTCEGYYQVAGNRLRCWRYYEPHGNQTLTEAVGNSCNPVMIQLAQKMGFDTFYRYIERFGITEKTGVDLPAEGAALVQNRETAGPVGLATMSFGQGLSVTPIQLISAVSAIGNEGRLMQPRLVKELTDDEGNTVERFEPEVLRQVVSPQTAEEVKRIMEYVVNESGGTAARVPGYRVGGKTGTAEKLDNGSYKTGKVVASMVAMAPMEDPRVAVLLIVDEPQGIKFGSTTAAPGVQEILSETLRHLNILPVYTQEELAEMRRSYVIVPELTGLSLSDAAGKLLGSDLSCIVSPAGREDDFIVVDQYPRAGESMAPGGQVCLYGE
jgi:stage V sporulation protein D (sporulation-specific penicillin-binding protein)